MAQPITIMRSGDSVAILVETTLSNFAALVWRAGRRVGPVNYYGRIRTAARYTSDLLHALTGDTVEAADVTTDSLAVTDEMAAEVTKARHMPSHLFLVPPR
jgi:hypothetical protein